MGAEPLGLDSIKSDAFVFLLDGSSTSAAWLEAARRDLAAIRERVAELEGLLQRSRDVLAGSPEADHSGNVRALLAAIDAALTTKDPSP